MAKHVEVLTPARIPEPGLVLAESHAEAPVQIVCDPLLTAHGPRKTPRVGLDAADLETILGGRLVVDLALGLDHVNPVESLPQRAAGHAIKTALGGAVATGPHATMIALARRDDLRVHHRVILGIGINERLRDHIRQGALLPLSAKTWSSLAAVKLNDAWHPLHVRFDPIENIKGSTMPKWAHTALHEGVHLVADDLASFSADGAVVVEHGAIIVSPRQYSGLDLFEWVNTFIANLQTAIHGTYCHFDFNKYRAFYRAEAQCRMNRRFDLCSVVDLLLWTVPEPSPVWNRGCASAWSGSAED